MYADTLRATTLRDYMENVTNALELLDELARVDEMGSAGAEVDAMASVRTAIHIQSVAEGC